MPSVVARVADPVFHERLVPAGWIAVYRELGIAAPAQRGGVVTWIASPVNGPAQFVPLGFYS